MALINQQTGRTVSEMRNPSEKEKLIGQQELTIFSLTSQNSELIRENIEMTNQQEEMEFTIAELRESLDRSEAQRKDLEHRLGTVSDELEREKNKPPVIKKEYSDKCYVCHKDRYEWLEKEAEKEREEADADREIAAAERAEAEKIHNDSEASIQERVEERIGKLTRPRRIKEHCTAISMMVQTPFIIVPFFYSVGVTIIALIRNEIFRSDFIDAVYGIGNFFAWTFNGIRFLISSAAGVMDNIEVPVIGAILWWLIAVIFTLLSVALLGGIGFGIYKLIEYLADEHSEKFEEPFLGMLVADLGIILFLGDIIRGFTEINLCLIFLLIIAAYFFIVYGLPVIIPAIAEKIEELINNR